MWAFSAQPPLTPAPSTFNLPPFPAPVTGEEVILGPVERARDCAQCTLPMARLNRPPDLGPSLLSGMGFQKGYIGATLGKCLFGLMG